MPQLLCWHCTHTDKVFKDKDKYLKHLKKQAKKRFVERKRSRHFQNVDEFMEYMGNTVKSPTHLEQFIRDNWKWFNENGFHNDSSSYDKTPKVIPCSKLDNIYVSVRRNERVSNSHNCPRTGVTNWGGSEKFESGIAKPTSYPGWYGSITIVFDEQSHVSGSEYFEHTTINTGSGGSSNGKSYRYELSLFDADFPAMKRAYWDNENWVTLGGEDYFHND